MRAQITMTPSESKRLIARGVKALPCVQKALDKHTIIVAGGTTNAFVLEELTGENVIPRSAYTVGIITDGKTGVSREEGRVFPFTITNGKLRPREYHWKAYIPESGPGDVFIKGGNALDHTGLAAVLASNNMGGTIGTAWGPLMQRGVNLVVPIGLEKMVPDVREAIEFMGGHPADEAIGDRASLMPMLGAKVVTEITALQLLYNVEAKCIAAGGVGGSEGAVVLVIDGEDADIQRAMEGVRDIKGEPLVN